MNDTETPETPETPANTNIPQFDSIPAGFRRFFGLVRHIIETAILSIFLLAICGVLPSQVSDFLQQSFRVISYVVDGGAAKQRVHDYAWLFAAVPALALVVLLIIRVIQRWKSSVKNPKETALQLIKNAFRKPFYLYWIAAIAAIAAVAPCLRYGHSKDIKAWVDLILLIVGTRIFKRPIVYALAMFLLFVLDYGLTFWKVSYPMIEDIHRAFAHPILAHHTELRPGILIPTHIMPLRSVLLVLLPFLIAVYCIRQRFAWWKYILGWLAGWALLFGALFQSLPQRTDFFFAALNLALIVFMARLPLQRRALENMVGVSFESGPCDSKPSVCNTLSSLLAHAMALFLVLMVIGFAVVGHYEKEIAQFVGKGPSPPYYSPALVNVYDSVKDLFNKKKSKQLSMQPSMQKEEYDLLKNMDRTPRFLFEEIWTVVDPTVLEQQLVSLQPGFDALTQAAKADYCLFHDGERNVTPHFINLRLVSYGLAMRARLRIHQGRLAEALVDIETLLKVAGLLNTDQNGTLVAHMIAVAIRGIAISAAGDYFLFYRQDAAALDQLRRMLERNAPRVRMDFPSEILKRSEPGFRPVSPYFEIAMPGVAKANETFYWRWIQFDQLLLGLALESYRRDLGRYPDRLEELVPKYMARLPLDPIEGKLYPYENLGDDVKLGTPAYITSKDFQEWIFPAPKDDPELRKQLEAFKASKAKKQGGATR